jgi:penicillin amidase
MKQFFKKTILFLAVFVIGFLIFFLGFFFLSKPKYRGRASYDALKAEVKIITDVWGVPHIYGENEEDLFFACGYVQASERMWQMDLIRRTGFGRLAELFGTEVLNRDKYVRVMGLKEAARRDLDRLSPRMKDVLYAYCRGINSWLNDRNGNWPPEFLIMRYRPEPWTPLDSIIIKQVMAMLLCTDYPSEVVRANLLNRLGAERALEILEKNVEIPSFKTISSSLQGFMDVAFPQQSNGWVIAGEHTESGKPLLANDPHLEISLPPIWYEMHLECPTLNAIGVTIPGVPWILIGHNASIAWGVTNSTADTQDLYVERFNRFGDTYWEKGGWKPLIETEELIAIKGKREPERMKVLWTSRGPVLSPQILNSPDPISLKWTLFDGERTLDAFHLLNKSKNWKDFSAALSLFDAPSQNFIYADKNDNIGCYMSGKIPLRPKEAALFPFPVGQGEGDWQGYLEEKEKPNLFNPEEGMIITANNKIIPEDFPFYVSVDWDAPFRADRIKELLVQRDKHSVESLQAIQNDVFSKKGELVIPLVRQMDGDGGKLKQALDMLQNWDLNLNRGDEPALYSTFMNILHEEVFQDELKEDFRSFDFLFRRKDAGLLRILSDPYSYWFDDKETDRKEDRDEIFKRALQRAFKRLDWLYGSSDNWDWSNMNAVRFQHILGRQFLLRFFNIGSFPAGGGPFTVRVNYQTSYKTSWSASYRQIIDLSDWDRSVCVISSGQSGHFMSRFYDNQVKNWLSGGYHPMIFSPEKVKKNEFGTRTLRPRKKRP